MPFSDYFKGAVHHHKRFRIDIEDNIFQLGQFGQRGNGKNHFFRVSGISALSLQKSGAPVDLFKDYLCDMTIVDNRWLKPVRTASRALLLVNT